MLRKIRVILGIVVILLITMLFLDFTGVIHRWFAWLAKIQFVPAILAHSAILIAFIVVLTLLFGRIYCSVICPLGVLQDTVSWTSGRFNKRRFSYSPPLKWLRYGFLALFIIGLVAGASVIYTILDPYAAYGRIASNLFAPLYRWGNNLLAYFSERLDSYAFYPTDVWIKSWTTFGIAAATLGAVGYLAWRNGRTYCNTICPVGTILGFVSKFSLFKPVIDPEKCTKCSLCSKNCKAACIDFKNYRIDHSRCVTCFDCLGKCKFDAIHYTTKRPVLKEKSATKKKQVDSEDQGMSRRNFLAVASVVAVSNTLKAQAPVIDGGLAEIEDKKVPMRDEPVVPPGSYGLRHLRQHCSACQLCISACPNNILRPSSDLTSFMQPHMSFERGYCRPECVRCSEVCPTSAIRKIDTAEKSGTKIGTAVWIGENCIVNRDNEICTACQRHCPTDAIQLVPRNAAEGDTMRVPVVDTERCIGCGACEYLCPARPFSAIYVEGIKMHRTV